MGWTVALVAVGGGLAAIGAIRQGQARGHSYELQAEAYKLEAEQARIDAEVAVVEGLRQEVSRKRELAIISATNLASVSYDPYSSPSFLAISESNRHQAEKDVGFIRFNTLSARLSAITRAEQGFLAARELQGAGRYARNAGLLKGLTSLFDTGSQIAQIK